MNRWSAALCFGLIAITPGQAQSASPGKVAANLPAYDVVSIKLNKTGSGSTSISTNEGNFETSNAPLASLIQIAYGYRREQVLGLEGPVAAARFDIRAKVVDPDVKKLESMPESERGSMLRPILTDRFHLQFHIETRVQQVYELTVAKSGSKLTQTSAGDTHAEDKSKFRDLGPGSVGVHVSTGHAEMTAHDVQISALVNELSGQLRRPVVDKTGLTGRYDLWLKWTPERDSAAMDNGSNTADDPTLFTALQEQLGLRVEGAKLPVDVLVIDKMDMPTED